MVAKIARAKIPATLGHSTSTEKNAVIRRSAVATNASATATPTTNSTCRTLTNATMTKAIGYERPEKVSSL